MLDNFLDIIFGEDLRSEGDVTSRAIFTNEESQFGLYSKASGILCGLDIFTKVFHKLDPEIVVTTYKHNGDSIVEKDLIASVSGKILAILQAERIALNFISHLSGIATKTAEYVAAANGKAIILDTRKTIPGLRLLQKQAVKCGGGNNHRMGLYDMVMIKDNHIDAAGSITAAVTKVRKKWNSQFKIEVETRNLAEVQEAINNKVNVIMLDNMDNALTKKAVKLIGKRIKTEASGNMTLDRIASVSETGVDYISIGALTHTVKAFDFSLKKEG